MRETQYIGTTERADGFIWDLPTMPPDTTTYGMFGEEIELGRWELTDERLADLGWSRRDGMCVREVVQEEAWSSGLMIFTCLELDFGNGAKYRAFEWTHNPELDCEFDRQTGELWV